MYASISQGIVDCLARGDADAKKAGKRIVLSKGFPGSDRDVHSRFMDAMALVARYGRPDYFVTMTCNPYWPEITEQLYCYLVRPRRTDPTLWLESTMLSYATFMSS